MIWEYVEFSFRLDIRVQYNWCRATWFARQSRDQRSRGRRCRVGGTLLLGVWKESPFPRKIFKIFCLKMACYGTQWSRDFEDNMPATEAPNRFEPGEWAKNNFFPSKMVCFGEFWVAPRFTKKNHTAGDVWGHRQICTTWWCTIL